MSIQIYSKYRLCIVSSYTNTKTSVYSNQGGECTKSSTKILVHMRCAQRAHHMFMYAQLARTDFSTHKCTEVISAFGVVFVVQAGQHSSLHQLNITMFNTQCNIQSCSQRSLYRLQSWSID